MNFHKNVSARFPGIFTNIFQRKIISVYISYRQLDHIDFQLAKDTILQYMAELDRSVSSL